MDVLLDHRGMRLFVHLTLQQHLEGRHVGPVVAVVEAHRVPPTCQMLRANADHHSRVPARILKPYDHTLAHLEHCVGVGFDARKRLEPEPRRRGGLGPGRLRQRIVKFPCRLDRVRLELAVGVLPQVLERLA